jgi:hypothetical protein
VRRLTAQSSDAVELLVVQQVPESVLNCRQRPLPNPAGLELQYIAHAELLLFFFPGSPYTPNIVVKALEHAGIAWLAVRSLLIDLSRFSCYLGAYRPLGSYTSTYLFFMAVC